uniref:transposase n=1 Tax=Massilia sp. TWR1-2-2 TaxID=2804584 RepID=UPI003CE7C5B6
AAQTQDVVPNAVRLFDEFTYKARSWPRAWRVLLKAEVMALGENTRFIVTSLTGLDAGTLYEDIYCARGQAENYIKHLKDDLAADRTSCTSFLANCMRLLLHAAAYILHQQLRTQALQHTDLSQAQPSTVISKLFKIAVQVRQYKNKIVLHLPSACPVKHLLQTLTERLYLPTPARFLNSS